MPSTVADSNKITGAVRKVSDDQVKTCDFRALGILDASRLAPQSAANEQFARNLAETFASRFEVACEIGVISLDVAVCEAFVEGAAEKTNYLHALALGSHAEIGILQMDSVVLLALLDCLMGGSGNSTQTPREITEIEGQMAMEVVKTIAQELQKAWGAFKVEVKVGAQQLPEHLLHCLPVSATMLVPKFAMKIAAAEGNFQLMLPIPSIAPFLKPEPAASPSNLAVPASKISPRLAKDLLQVCFGLELVMDRGRLHANDILNLSAGQVVDLGTPAEAPAVVRIGGREAFLAVPVRKDGYRAAQLVERLNEEPASANRRNAGRYNSI